MKLNEKTISTLIKLYAVDQSIKIPANSNILRVKSINNTMMVKAEIPDVFPRDIYIYDTREFINVMGLIDNPVLDLSDDRFIKIDSPDGSQKLMYLESSPATIKSWVDKDPEISSIDFSVNVTEQQFQRILNSANTMKLAFVGFKSDGSNVTLSSFNKSQGSEIETNNFSIDLGSNDSVFCMQYKLDVHNLSVLLKEGDLKFDIDFSKPVSEIKTASGKTFWISLDSKSTSQ